MSKPRFKILAYGDVVEGNSIRYAINKGVAIVQARDMLRGSNYSTAVIFDLDKDAIVYTIEVLSDNETRRKNHD
jgi:hypothetical protein